MSVRNVRPRQSDDEGVLSNFCHTDFSQRHFWSINMLIIKHCTVIKNMAVYQNMYPPLPAVANPAATLSLMLLNIATGHNSTPQCVHQWEFFPLGACISPACTLGTDCIFGRSNFPGEFFTSVCCTINVCAVGANNAKLLAVTSYGGQEIIP